MENTNSFLNSISSTVTRSVRDKRSFDKLLLLKEVLQKVTDYFKAEAFSIFLEKEEDNEVFSCVAGSGYAGDIVNKAEYRKDEGFTGFILRTQEPFNIKNKTELIEKIKTHKINTSGKYDDILWTGNRHFRNLIAIPLLQNEKSIGLIKVENKIDDEFFSDEEFNAMKFAGQLLSLSITQIDFYQKWKKSEQFESIIQRIPNLLKKDNKFETLLEDIVKLTMNFLNTEVCFLYLEKDGYLECAAGAGYAQSVIGRKEVKYKLGDYYGLTGAIADSRQLWIINSKEELSNLEKEGIAKKLGDRHYEKGWEFKNLIGTPLKIDNNILGVIKAENKIGTSTFTSYDIKALQLISDVASLAINNYKSQVIKEKEEKEEETIEQKIKNAKDKLRLGKFQEAIKIGLTIVDLLKDIETKKRLVILSTRYNQLMKQEVMMPIDELIRNEILIKLFEVFDTLDDINKNK
ncbi:GAF domain-containing protein [Alistipes sp. ZOR0009]|uniref:GAF domain-containing protein n=1 Tax=Alistipes sp. ZOR0009 TaxID=1339253 RepID=UPI000648F5A7|nr:GAF domain-containing protein [Alistipes sp. ZOR0009]